MDLGEIAIYGLIDTCSLKCQLRSGLRKNATASNPINLIDLPPPVIQIVVAKRDFRTPIATVELGFENGETLFKESFIGLTDIKDPIVRMLFSIKKSSTSPDMRQWVLDFLFFSTQLKHGHNRHSNTNELLLNPKNNLIQPVKQTVVYIKSQV